MDIKEKVYTTLVVNNFFNTTDVFSIVNRLSKTLGISNGKANNAIKELVQERRLSVSNHGREIRNSGKINEGVFHASKGSYGFVTVKGQEQDIYVPNSNGAREGDIVELGYNGSKGQERAFISRIIKRQTNNIVGVVRKTDTGYYVFVPDDKKLPEYILPQGKETREHLGKKCSLKVTIEPTSSKDSGAGVIDKVYGYADDPIVENIAIADSYGFSKEFPAEVMAEVSRIPQEVKPEELKGRLDLRHLKFTTWDPKGCKDKDDAIYVEKTQDGYRCYVAIADVSHYVKKGSAIDKEAYARGTSCYLGDGVYPMLPPALSNGICSLNEGVDRLVLASIIDIDKNGKIKNYEFHEAVINVAHSLSYEEAEDIRLGRNGKDVEFSDVKDVIDTLYEAHEVLDKKLKSRGAISFKSKEPTFKFDWTRSKVLDVTNASQDVSHAVVEQFMILNNEALPMYFESQGLHGLYRVHEKPREDKMSTVNSMLRNLELEHHLEPNPQSYQRLTELIKDSKYEDVLTSFALRSMSKAKYQPENLGHFGLSSQGYAHTTSPIRRYPDLVMHRVFKEHLKGRNNTYSMSSLETMGEHLSEQERKAEAAEVQSDKVLFTYWASLHVGETFEGYISKISQGSITVRIGGMIDVCVPVSELENGVFSDYRFTKNKMAIVDRYTGKTYNLADSISIKITEANVADKMIYATPDLEKSLDIPQEIQIEDKKEVKQEVSKPQVKQETKPKHIKYNDNPMIK